MDRGFGRFKLLGQMHEKGMRFVVRLKQDIGVDPGDERLITLKWLSYAMALVQWNRVYDVKEKREKIVRYGWRKIKRAEIKGDVYLVISWLEGEETPWLLLTNEAIRNAADAWRIVRIYWRRMEIEVSYPQYPCKLLNFDYRAPSCNLLPRIDIDRSDGRNRTRFLFDPQLIYPKSSRVVAIRALMTFA
jgi:hypothetical protein